MASPRRVIVVVQDGNAVFHRAHDPACPHCRRGRHLMSICVPGVRYLLRLPSNMKLSEGDTFAAELSAELVEWIARRGDGDADADVEG